MARIDVLIPAYNVATTVREAVDSIRRQSVRDLRIVIVDDGSTDATADILADMADEDDRIRIVTRANGGIVAALNEGLQHCSAPYVARFDADDVSFPDRLQLQADFLEARADCVAVGGAVEHIDEAGAPLAGLPQPGDPMAADPSKAPALEPYIIHPFAMMRRSALDAAGGYRHAPNCEDSDLYWRLMDTGALVNLPDVLGRYRVHTASISSSIVSGRVMAIGSQLAALSALRRRSRRRDIEFEPAMRTQLKEAGTLQAMAELVEPMLDETEGRHLRLAAAAKLMEFARYRPYELEASDCAFVRGALPNATRLAPHNRKEVDWYVSMTAARLVRKGKWSEALLLAPASALPVTAARVLLQR
jgi:glycosyltransferase involved in cell wall biosynthesis